MAENVETRMVENTGLREKFLVQNGVEVVKLRKPVKRNYRKEFRKERFLKKIERLKSAMKKSNLGFKTW
jgi:hypothetical protein